MPTRVAMKDAVRSVQPLRNRIRYCATLGSIATSITSAAAPNNALGLCRPRLNPRTSQRHPAPGPMVFVCMVVSPCPEGRIKCLCHLS